MTLEDILNTSNEEIWRQYKNKKQVEPEALNTEIVDLDIAIEEFAKYSMSSESKAAIFNDLCGIS